MFLDRCRDLLGGQPAARHKLKLRELDDLMYVNNIYIYIYIYIYTHINEFDVSLLVPLRELDDLLHVRPILKLRIYNFGVWVKRILT